MSGFFGDDPNWMYDPDPAKRQMAKIGGAFRATTQMGAATGREFILDGKTGALRPMTKGEQASRDSMKAGEGP